MTRIPSAVPEALEPRTFLSAAKPVATNYEGAFYNVSDHYSYRLKNGFVRSGNLPGTITLHQNASGVVTIVPSASLFDYIFTASPDMQISGTVAKGKGVFSSSSIGDPYFTGLTTTLKFAADGSKFSGSVVLYHGSAKDATKLTITASLGGFVGSVVPIGSPINLTNPTSVGGEWAGMFERSSFDMMAPFVNGKPQKITAKVGGTLTVTSDSGNLFVRLSDGILHTVSNTSSSELTGITTGSIITVRGDEQFVPGQINGAYVNGSKEILVNAKIVMKGKKATLQGDISIGGIQLATFSLSRVG